MLGTTFDDTHLGVSKNAWEARTPDLCHKGSFSEASQKLRLRDEFISLDDFVARCARRDRQSPEGHHSMLVGTVEEQSVLPYYPRDGQPGIIRPFVELRSARLRLANIYVVRPLELGHPSATMVVGSL